MCEPTSPRVDDAPGKPVGQERKVQTEIRIQGQWFYRGPTADVLTLQRLLTAAVAASDSLIARLRKAREQRDAWRYRALAAISALVGHTKTQSFRGQDGEQLHVLERMLTPEMHKASNADLLEVFAQSLLREFASEGYTAKSIVLRVQDW